MRLLGKIKITLADGSEIHCENNITYAGADELGKAISERKVIVINKLYLRYATVITDANDVATNFNENNDLKAVKLKDFTTLGGSAGFSQQDLTSGSSLSGSDSRFVSNVVSFKKQFGPTDLPSDFIPADSAGTNYSNIYYMGLGTDEDIVFSVKRLERGKYFGIPSTGQVTIDYKLVLDL